MSEHRATVTWARGDREFSYEGYSRDHEWAFEGGIRVPASATADFMGDAERVDPEKAFVASIASCHMLTFLAIAARKRLVVNAWDDDAAGFMEKNEDGRLAITRVVLRPRIAFGGDEPGPDAIGKLHEAAHRNCFIANSVRAEVTVEAV